MSQLLSKILIDDTDTSILLVHKLAIQLSIIFGNCLLSFNLRGSYKSTEGSVYMKFIMNFIHLGAFICRV